MKRFISLSLLFVSLVCTASESYVDSTHDIAQIKSVLEETSGKIERALDEYALEESSDQPQQEQATILEDLINEAEGVHLGTLNLLASQKKYKKIFASRDTQKLSRAEQKQWERQLKKMRDKVLLEEIERLGYAKINIDVLIQILVELEE